MNHNQQSSEVRHDDENALSDFLASLMDYTPTIPDELVEHYLAKSGFQCPDVRLKKVSQYLGQTKCYCCPVKYYGWDMQGFISLDVIPTIWRIRLVAVAAQKFVSDVATDALQQCKARQAAVVRDKKEKQQRDKRLIMNMDDLSKALQEYGVNVKHQEYFADNPSAGLESAQRDE